MIIDRLHKRIDKSVKEDEELAASYGLKLDPDQIDNSEIVDESEEG